MATRALRDDANAILGGATAVVEIVLADREIALAGPVGARFRTDYHGSSGIEITVTLRDPAKAALARSAIAERLGGESRCDRLVIV